MELLLLSLSTLLGTAFLAEAVYMVLPHSNKSYYAYRNMTKKHMPRLVALGVVLWLSVVGTVIVILVGV